MKTKVIGKLRKSYKAKVNLPEDAAKQVRFLSRAMVCLWNKGIGEAELWLEENRERKERIRYNSEALGGLPAEVKRIFYNDKCHRLSAYAFNYWLTKARGESITLKDGTEVKLDAASVDMEREVLRKLAGSYKSFFKLKKQNKDARARAPGPKEEHWFQTLSWSSFSIADGVLYAPGYDRKRIEIPLGEYLRKCIQGKEVAQATLAYRGEAFELSVVTTSPLPPQIERPKFFRAIDLGAGDVAVTDSDGTEFLIPSRRSDKYWRKQVRHIEARTRLRKKASRGYERLMKARRAVFSKSMDQHVSYQRKLAHALLEEKVECFVIGKPKTRLGLAKTEEGTPDQHWGAQNTGYLFRLLRFIKEKAEERGVRVLEFEDPRRRGSMDVAENKFHASRALLAKGLEETALHMPRSFSQKHFKFGN